MTSASPITPHDNNNNNKEETAAKIERQHTTDGDVSAASEAAAKAEAKAVQVYVRIRPLIRGEEGHEEMEYKVVLPATTRRNNYHITNENNSNKNNAADVAATTTTLQVKIPTKERVLNPAFLQNTTINDNKSGALGAAVPPPPPPPRRHNNNDWRSFDGFTQILDMDSTNKAVYHAAIRPMVLQEVVEEKRSACVFTYGHTGSGKSHTLLGYEGGGGQQQDTENEGVYKYAASELMERLGQRTITTQKTSTTTTVPNDNSSSDHLNRSCLLVRVTELYKDEIRDLLTGDRCTIRQGKDGVAKIRGPMVVANGEGGKIEEKVLGRVCHTIQQVMECVDDACNDRRTGTSTHHDQSSRSHLVMELEVVTPALLEQRRETADQGAHLTRLQWLRFEKTMGKNKDRPLPKWTEEFMASPNKLSKDIKSFEQLVKESQSKLKTMEREVGGGTLVFCDLAGNEYARDALASTKQELEEAAEINKSLLSVKEMIRGIGTANSKHVSYRDSKLAMFLRRHVQGKARRAVMLGHVSPSQEYVRKSINTLTYCSMVGKGNTAATERRK